GSPVVLGLIPSVVAPASLVALLFVFGLVLKLRLGIEIGGGAMLMGSQLGYGQPQVTLFNAATVASAVLTGGCGVLAAARRFHRWRPDRCRACSACIRVRGVRAAGAGWQSWLNRCRASW